MRPSRPPHRLFPPQPSREPPANKAARRVEDPVDMDDPADILAKMGYDGPVPVHIDAGSCSPWFRMMFDTAILAEELLDNQDIGSLNLKAAAGLPGAEAMRVDPCVQTLNAWSRQVRAFTEEHWSQFERSPGRFNNSAACFQMASLVTVLQEHLGVRYDPSFMEGDYNATDSQNLFVHGLLFGRGGTCITLPVLYAAIGRRLGYPLKLVRAKQHLFVRWEASSGERFNIESTAVGFEPLADEHFRHHPQPLTDKDLQSGFYLRSLQPTEELTDFLCLRVECLIDNLRPIEALQSAFLATRLLRDDMGLKRTWCVTTLLARALEQARHNAGCSRYADLDLRAVSIPEGKDGQEQWVATVVRAHLHRIAQIHQPLRGH